MRIQVKIMRYDGSGSHTQLHRYVVGERGQSTIHEHSSVLDEQEFCERIANGMAEDTVPVFYSLIREIA